MGRINLGSGGAGIGSPNINKAATTAGKKARAVNAKLRAELQRAQAQSQQHLREIAGLRRDVIELMKAPRRSEYRVVSGTNVNLAPPTKLTFSNIHVEDTDITTRITANTQIQIEEDGVYRIDFRGTYSSTTAFIGMFVYISVNGVIQKFGGAEGLTGGATASFSSSTGSHVMSLNQNDYVEMFITRHASTAGTTYLYSDQTYIRLTRQGDIR